MKDYKEYASFLEDHGIRPSSQRVIMLKYLNECKDHPSADKIYMDLSESLPSISKATVYNNLKLFVESGIVIEVRASKTEVNYDIKSHNHGHFVCTNCNSIEDFDIEDNFTKPSSLEGYTIEDSDVFLYGLCKDCAN